MIGRCVAYDEVGSQRSSQGAILSMKNFINSRLILGFFGETVVADIAECRPIVDDSASSFCSELMGGRVNL